MNQNKRFFLFFKIFIILFLLFVITINIFISTQKPNIFTQYKKQLFSFNQGNSYSGQLNLWRLLVQGNDWNNAAKLELSLNQSEISDYKFNYQPSELQKKEDLLNNKTDKSVEDYIELSRIQFLLNQKSDSFNSIKKARQLDPIRDDVNRLYYFLSK